MSGRLRYGTRFGPATIVSSKANDNKTVASCNKEMNRVLGIIKKRDPKRFYCIRGDAVAKSKKHKHTPEMPKFSFSKPRALTDKEMALAADDEAYNLVLEAIGIVEEALDKLNQSPRQTAQVYNQTKVNKLALSDCLRCLRTKAIRRRVQQAG